MWVPTISIKMNLNSVNQDWVFAVIFAEDKAMLVYVVKSTKNRKEIRCESLKAAIALADKMNKQRGRYHNYAQQRVEKNA